MTKSADGPGRDAPARFRAVLEAVASVPAGKVMSYGDIAEYSGMSSARGVGQILARHGDGLPWHRVVRADGGVAAHLRDEQLSVLRSEGVVITGDRVDMRRSRWNGSQTRPARQR